MNAVSVFYSVLCADHQPGARGSALHDRAGESLAGPVGTPVPPRGTGGFSSEPQAVAKPRASIQWVGTAGSLTAADRRMAAWHSTVTLKAVTAVSGLIMMLFLLAHMYGNLKLFAGRAAFDSYAAHLRTLGEPLLPYSGALWIMRVVLLASVVAHVYAAVTLWGRARTATGGRGGGRYQNARARRGVQRTYASFTMRWGGVTIALFVVFHLLQLTTNTIHPGGASSSPYQRTVNGFQLWWVVLSYTAAMVAVGFHVRHGFWSAFATLGANTGIRRRRHLNQIAVTIAVLMILGFLLPPFAVFLGQVREP